MANSIIERAEEFFYFEDILPERIEAWAKSRCHSFENVNQEHPLEHTQLFDEYCILFEDIFSEFLNAENINLKEFYNVISDQYTDKNSFAKMLTSAIDFDSFCQMMVDVREGCGVVFCPPLISLYDDSNDDDCKHIGRDDTDYIKGDFDFIADDKKSRIISYYEEDDNADDFKSSNDSLYDMKKEKSEK